ncbi:MAG TPA: hypothetical protein VNN81_05865 [Bradyrhizobium sp.]|jgi:hypothetical protein|nr:hypothetical protein [Bradyrhizobium sp.]
MAAHGQAIRPLLIEQRLEQMGEDGDRDRRQQKVVAVDPVVLTAAAAVEPPAGRKRAKHVLIGAPCQRLRHAFGLRAGVFCDGVCDFDVGLGRPYPIKRHRMRSP